VLNHIGGPIGAGAPGVDTRELRAQWLEGMASLAACANLVVKLGGLGTSTFGCRLFAEPEPPTALALAKLWRPWIEPVIQLFGPARCMFESNYPVDARAGGLEVLWSCFKLLAEAYSDDERDWLCRKTAARTYGVGR
jgi:predicted TIM-barrel fold metal-dependent hydrolase